MASPGSFEWLRDQITEEIQEERPGLDFWIQETHPDYVVIQTYGPESAYWKIAYTTTPTANEPGEVTLGEWQELVQRWAPVTKALRMVVPVHKAAASQRITLGVVLEPDDTLTKPDLQGDVMKSEDIELSAHAWMERSKMAGEQHADIVKGAKVVESYIAPCDFVVKCADGTEETVLKGSWVLGMRWPEKVWKRIEAGELTGYSVGGHGLRVPIGEDGGDG